VRVRLPSALVLRAHHAALGPYCAGIFDPRGWGGGSEETANAVTLELTRVVLAIGVFAIGVELPKAYMKRHWRSLAMLLGPIMTYVRSFSSSSYLCLTHLFPLHVLQGWFVSAALIYALIPNLNFLSSLAIAACLTPTDPILAAAIIGGKYADKHVPAHLRHLLAAESGCNDGAAFPFLYIALYLTIYGGGPGIGLAIRDWFLILWLCKHYTGMNEVQQTNGPVDQVILGIVIGVSLGIAFRYMMKFCENHDLIDRHSYVAQYISLALLATGSTVLLGSDDLLSSFACGTAFAWDGFFNRQTEESVFSSVIDLLFNITAFVYVGAWMPFDKFQEAELSISVWRLIVIAILVLLLRRLPIVIALYRWIPDIKTFREAIFSGHFGPIGIGETFNLPRPFINTKLIAYIGAVFISTLAAEVLHQQTSEEDRPHQTQLLMDSIQPIVAFMVLASILVHGLSIPGFSLGRRVHSVSRTWSRATGAAEWTNQTRRAERGDEIVINRDRDENANEMERGEAVEEKEHDIPTATNSPGELDEKKVIDEDGLGEKTTGQEVPPDGTDTVQEWREGHHKVVEKRAGPGEEVSTSFALHTA